MTRNFSEDAKLLLLLVDSLRSEVTSLKAERGLDVDVEEQRKRERAHNQLLEAVAGSAQDTAVELTANDVAVITQAMHQRVIKSSAVVTDDVGAAEASYSQAQLDELIALVNELKAKLNTMNN